MPQHVLGYSTRGNCAWLQKLTQRTPLRSTWTHWLTRILSSYRIQQSVQRTAMKNLHSNTYSILYTMGMLLSPTSRWWNWSTELTAIHPRNSWPKLTQLRPWLFPSVDMFLGIWGPASNPERELDHLAKGKWNLMYGPSHISDYWKEWVQVWTEEVGVDLRAVVRIQ